jgi:hypothetical protein
MSKSTSKVVAWIGTVGVIVAAVVAGSFSLLRKDPERAPATSAAASASGPGAPAIAVGGSVSGSQIVVGSAPGAPGASGARDAGAEHSH